MDYEGLNLLLEILLLLKALCKLLAVLMETHRCKAEPLFNSKRTFLMRLDLIILSIR